MNYHKIQAALETRVKDIAGVPYVAYENVKYDPTTGVSHLRTRFIPISRTQKVLGINEDNGKPFWLDYQGIFQIVINVPESQGSKETNDLVNNICDTFETATDLEFEDVFVTIKKVERTRGINETPWFKTSVNIHWYSHSK